MSLEKARISWSAKQLKSMVGNGSAKNSNIVTRDTILKESFEQFFEED